MKDIVIIGGGPVGLFTAIQIKRANPGTTVTVYERYAEYKRSHVLSVDRNCYKEAIIGDDDFSNYLKGLDKIISTQQLESGLKEQAQKVGVEIKNETITDYPNLIARHANPILIAADGANSGVRKTYFGDSFRQDSVAQYLLQIKYQARSTSEKTLTKLKYATELYPIQKHVNRHIFEQVGKKKTEDGKQQITLNVYLSEDEFKKMSGATFKDPYSLTDSRIPAECQKAVWTILNARKELQGEEYVSGSAKVTAIPLKIYAAKSAHATIKTDDKETDCYLVGDALAGVPYLRSFNNGLKCSVALSKEISQYLTSDQDNENARTKCINNYLNKSTKITDAEVLAATGKSFYFYFYQIWIFISNLVPWQIFKLSTDKRRLFSQPIIEKFAAEIKAQLKSTDVVTLEHGTTELMRAAYHGNIYEQTITLNHLRAVDKFGKNALYYALKGKKYEAALELFLKMLILNASSEEIDTAFHYFIQMIKPTTQGRGLNVDTAKTILAAINDVYTLSSTGLTKKEFTKESEYLKLARDKAVQVITQVAAESSAELEGKIDLLKQQRDLPLFATHRNNHFIQGAFRRTASQAVIDESLSHEIRKLSA